MPPGAAFGVTAAPRADHARLGRELERLGYEELWINDTRRGDGIATLAEIAAGTATLPIAVGVVALSEHGPGRIVARVRDAGLPLDRLTLGVGSGSSASLGLVRDGVNELRRMLPAVPVAIAAVGPRMASVAGELADVVVANWALPDRLDFVRERVAEGAAATGRPAPRLVAYIRTAIGAGAADRLRREMNRYRAHGGGHYARAFDAQPDVLVGVALERPDRAALAAALVPYRAIADTVVVRGLPAEDTIDSWLEIAATAAP